MRGKTIGALLHLTRATRLHAGFDLSLAARLSSSVLSSVWFVLPEQCRCQHAAGLAALLQVPALLAVGLEGCWGLVLCSFLLPVTSFIRGPDGLPLDDALAAFRAILSNVELGGAVYLSIFSIAFFNFFGVSGEPALGSLWSSRREEEEVVMVVVVLCSSCGWLHTGAQLRHVQALWVK